MKNLTFAKRLVFFMLISLSTSACQAKTVRIASVKNIWSHILQLSKPIGKKTVALFDIDDTIFVNPDFHATLVEPGIKNLIAKFHKHNMQVGGLTFRGFNFAQRTATLKRLKTAGLHFNFKPSSLPSEARYAGGILFRSYMPNDYYSQLIGINPIGKGELLKRVIRQLPEHEKPEQIIFVDDKFYNVQDVDNACKELGIESLCCYYPKYWEEYRTYNPWTWLKKFAYSFPKFIPDVFKIYKHLKNPNPEQSAKPASVS